MADQLESFLVIVDLQAVARLLNKGGHFQVFSIQNKQSITLDTSTFQFSSQYRQTINNLKTA